MDRVELEEVEGANVELLELAVFVYTAMIPRPPQASDGSPSQATLGPVEIIPEESKEVPQ